MNDLIRPAIVAGQFYPGHAAELTSMIDKFLAKAETASLPAPVQAVIVPHAGYIYSGQVAASGLKALKPNCRRFFILAANHSSHCPWFKLALSGASHFETPLGRVPVSPQSSRLLENQLFSIVDEAHSSHIIEVELPFLQRLFSDFEIIPIVTGDFDMEDIPEAVSAIMPLLDDESAIIVSSDLSHYHPYPEAKRLDAGCIAALADMDCRTALRSEACGLPAAMIMLEIAKQQGWQGKTLQYMNSGDSAGDKSAVVGYAAIAYYGQTPAKCKEAGDEAGLGREDKQRLLKLARDTLAEYLSRGQKPAINEDSLPPALLETRSCFVTLTKQGDLRGCIGHIIAQDPLYVSVMENAINAAVNDSRFEPVRPKELSGLDIEISVLSPAVLLAYSDSQDLLANLVTGKHGVILQDDIHHATYLPQVWEHFASKEEFLNSLCQKAGLRPSAWRTDELDVLTYTATAFAERDFLN